MKSQTVIFKINNEGDEITFDPHDFPFEEGCEFEKQTKMGVAKYISDLNDGTNNSYLAMFWKGAVEHAAARTGASFTVAARAHPFEAFRRTVNIGLTYKTMRDADAVPAPAGEGQDEAGEAHPTMPAADGSTAPSSPATSAAPPAPRRSRSSASSTSATSPTSSASNPGTGTD